MFALGAIGALDHLLLLCAGCSTRLADRALSPPARSSGRRSPAPSSFSDLPDLWMLPGRTVIVASGLFVFYREAMLGKR